MATLTSTVKTIVVELEIDWRHWSMRDVFREACEVLGIESAGLTASRMAKCCLNELFDADAISDEQSTSSGRCGRCVIAPTGHGPKFLGCRKEKCCQLETPVCDLTVWCDFIGARHASITRESSRAEREGSTHVGRRCFEHGASSHDGDDVKDFHANRCAFTFFFTHINELTQMHWKDLAGIKVELKELLDGRSEQHGEEQRGADSGLDGTLFGGGASLRGPLPSGVL